VVSGRLHIASDDAWVLADESFVALEFESKTAETYAKN